MRASNAIYDVPEGRPVWKTVPIRLAVTIVTMLLLAVSAVAVVVTGSLADRVGQILGVGSTAVTVWEIAKWPVLLVIVGFLFGLLYWASPNAKHGFRWVTPGGILAIVLWVRASAAFGLYVANFGSYNKTYGIARISDHLSGLVVDLQQRHPARRGTQRRAPTRSRHAERPPRNQRAIRATSRHYQDSRQQTIAATRPPRPAVDGVPIPLGGSPACALNVYCDEPEECDSPDIRPPRGRRSDRGDLGRRASLAPAGRLADQLRLALEYRVVIARDRLPDGYPPPGCNA